MILLGNIVLFNLLSLVFSLVWSQLNHRDKKSILKEALKHYLSFVGICALISIIVYWLS